MAAASGSIVGGSAGPSVLPEPGLTCSGFLLPDQRKAPGAGRRNQRLGGVRSLPPCEANDGPEFMVPAEDGLFWSSYYRRMALPTCKTRLRFCRHQKQ